MKPEKKKYAVVIPARYQSSRFPGKPLVKLLGRELILRVWDRCVSAVGVDLVYVATDDERIAQCCESAGAKVLMTKPDCMTGMDRVVQSVQNLQLDFVVNVQGDEPVVDPEAIQRVISLMSCGDFDVVNCMCPILEEEEFRSSTVPKVVCDAEGRLLYMSRAAIPTDKALGLVEAWKQVCIYGISMMGLEKFSSVENKTPLESIEDIEILRFLEMGCGVHMIETRPGSVAVDIPEDVERAEKVLRENRL